MTMHTLIQDNGGCNDIPNTKIKVEIFNSDLEWNLRKYFGWRKDVTISRFSKEGSYHHDRFIKYLSEQGY